MRSPQLSSSRFTSLLQSFRLATLVGALAMTVSACGPYDPNFGGPYGGGYNGGYYNDGFENRREIERSRQERRELERERERAQDERERLERERSNSHGGSYGGWRNPPPPPPRPAPQVDRCPPGFSPSERKCSPDERRRGCRDIRTPSGLGCVSR